MSAGPGSTSTGAPAPDGAAPTRARVGGLALASVGVAVGLALTAALGMLGRSELYGDAGLRDAFLANDLIDLVFVAPLVALAGLAARRGSWLGTLAWPAGAWLVVYVSFPYVLALPRGGLWLAYLTLFTASAYLAVASVASIDGAAVRRRLEGAVPARAVGATLAGLGVAFLAFAAGSLAASAARGGEAGPGEAVFAADLLVSPAWIVGGVALARRTAFGYAVALALLAQLAAAFTAVVLVVAVAPLATGAALATTDLVVLLAMSLVAVAPLVAFVRGVSPSHRSARRLR